MAPWGIVLFQMDQTLECETTHELVKVMGVRTDKKQMMICSPMIVLFAMDQTLECLNDIHVETHDVKQAVCL
jgi:hypothetical protein